jgi:hypothetical protein
VRVYVRWRDEERGTSGVFNLRLADTLPASALGEPLQTLGAYLREWKEQTSPPEPLPAVLAGLGPPALGNVTGLVPGKLANRQNLFMTLLYSSLLAAGVGVLLGLSFVPIPTGAGWYVLLAVVVNVLFQQLPLWRYRDKPVA